MDGSGYPRPVFHRYSEGYRFAKLACDLVEKHGFIAYQGEGLPRDGNGCPSGRSRSRPRSISCGRLSHRNRDGDLAFACYCMDQSSRAFSCGTIRSTRCGASRRWAWTSSGSQVPRRRGHHREPATLHRDHAGTDRDLLHLQRRAVRRGAFEAQLTGDRTPMMICFYWILKLKARFLSGDYAEALAAADKAKALLWASPLAIQLLDYFYYTALTVAALYENASADEQREWRELLTAHRNNCASGPKTIRRLSATSTRWCRPRSPVSKARYRCHASVREGHSIGSRERLRPERGRGP
jgi:hypothetical protein